VNDLPLPANPTFTSVTATDGSFTSLFVTDLSLVNDLPLPANPTFTSVTATDGSFTSLFVTDLSIINGLTLPSELTVSTLNVNNVSYLTDVSASLITLDQGVGGVDTIITGDVVQGNAFNARGLTVVNQTTTTDLSVNDTAYIKDISAQNITVTDTIYTNDLAATTAWIGRARPVYHGAYGISYESLSNTRQRYLFGEGFVLGDVSAQTVPPVGAGTVVMGSQYLTFPPELLRVNAFFNSDIMKVETISSGQYLSLDVSNNKDDFIDSLVSFNSYLTIGGTNLDKLQQTVIFLHPNEILDCSGTQNGQGYWPSDASGDIIVDTRSIGTIPSGKTASLTYGTRHLYVPSTIPSTINSLSGDIYVPHIAFQFQNASSFTIFDGNLSMNQRVFN
jgi:hypothetical protein